MTRMGTIMNMECEFEIYRGDGVDRIYCISAIRIPPPFPALAPEMSSLFFGQEEVGAIEDEMVG